MKKIYRTLVFFAALLSPLSLWAFNTQSKDETREIQTILRLNGLYSDRIDGILGPKTMRAIRLYQIQRGLPQTEEISYIYERLHEETKSALAATSSENKGDVNVKRNAIEETKVATPKDSIGPSVVQSQPVTYGPVQSVRSQDKRANPNLDTTGAVAIAAIDAARHSMEESKTFYERFTWVIASLIGFLVTGGFVFLRREVRKVAEEKATALLTEKTGTINLVEAELKRHLAGREAFHNEIDNFKNQPFIMFVHPMFVHPDNGEAKNGSPPPVHIEYIHDSSKVGRDRLTPH
jgi:Putative peptidoglycan binding domain